MSPFLFLQRSNGVACHQISIRCLPLQRDRWLQLLRSTACRWQLPVTIIIHIIHTATFPVSYQCFCALNPIRHPLGPARSEATEPGHGIPVAAMERRRPVAARQGWLGCNLSSSNSSSSNHPTIWWASRIFVNLPLVCYSAPSNGRETYRSFQTSRSPIRYRVPYLQLLQLYIGPIANSLISCAATITYNVGNWKMHANCFRKDYFYFSLFGLSLCTTN